MAIRPVDMQAIMPRALETSRTNANENVRPQAEHQQFSGQVQKNVANDQRSVVSTNKTEGTTVDKDGRGNSGGRKDGRRRKKGGNESSDEKTHEKKSLLDISL